MDEQLKTIRWKFDPQPNITAFELAVILLAYDGQSLATSSLGRPRYVMEAWHTCNRHFIELERDDHGFYVPKRLPNPSQPVGGADSGT